MVKVNKEKCIGCGACMISSPKGFKFDEEGKASVADSKAEGIDEAIEGCPTGALS